MRHEVRSVFIAGGTGFLGYHSALLFRKMGIAVATAALPGEIDLGTWFPSDIPLAFRDLFASTDDELVKMLSGGFDTFVYALGPDDRVIPKAPALDFFREKLVIQCRRVCAAAKRAGIRRCIVMNSYFSEFDRRLDGRLSGRHPYIRARREQEEAVFSLGEDGVFEVVSLEFPFIFGTMPGRKPLWRDSFLSHFEGGKALFFPGGGGTACIAVSGIAEAVVAASFNGENGRAYPVGKENLTFRDLLNLMMESIGDPRRYRPVPAFLAAIGGRRIDADFRKKGRQSGLDHARLMGDILSRKFFLDPEPTETALGYSELGFAGGTDVRESIRETLRACYPERFTR